MTGLLLAATLMGEATVAQVLPNSHWGGSIFPESRKSTVGLHAFSFTQFGKELDENGSYRFIPYNDMEETLGFNVVSISQSGYVHGSSVVPSGASYHVTAYAGIVSDVLTEPLQNGFVHLNRFLGNDFIQPVPRSTEDLPFGGVGERSTSRGPTKWNHPILGFSLSYVVPITFAKRIPEVPKARDQPTPLFLGGGIGLGTVNQEAYIMAGSNWIPWEIDLSVGKSRGSFAIESILGGAVLRAGVPFHISRSITLLDDLYSNFVDVQAGVGMRFRVASYPMSLKFSLTSSTGFFVARRSDSEVQVARDFARSACGDQTSCDWNILTTEQQRSLIRAQFGKRYQTKRPARERFFSIEFEMGKFHMEYMNDVIGGKDKGPSWSASVTYITSTRVFNRLLPKAIR